MTGEGERVSSSPLPLPLQLFFFCFRSNFRAITRLETLATQARLRALTLTCILKLGIRNTMTITV